MRLPGHARARHPRDAAMGPAAGAPPLGLPEPRASLRSHPQELVDDRGHPVETPRSSSILATLPFVGSKKSVFAFSQPPMLGSLTVNRPGGVGNLSLFLARTCLFTSR